MGNKRGEFRENRTTFGKWVFGAPNGVPTDLGGLSRGVKTECIPDTARSPLMCTASLVGAGAAVSEKPEMGLSRERSPPPAEVFREGWTKPKKRHNYQPQRTCLSSSVGVGAATAENRAGQTKNVHRQTETAGLL